MMINPFRGALPVWVCQLFWAVIFAIELAWCYLRFAA